MGAAVNVAVVLVGRNRIDEEALGNGRLGNGKAEGVHAVAQVEEDAALASFPYVVGNAVAVHQVFGQGIEGVGHHVAGTQQGELFAAGPVGFEAGAHQQRFAAQFCGLQPGGHNGTRVEAVGAGSASDGDGNAPNAAIVRGNSVGADLGIGVG